MSKIFRTVGLLVLIAAFMFGISKSVAASPPVPPPTEGFVILTETDIDCVGGITETESYVWTYGTGTFDAAGPAMGEGDRAAQIRYTEDLTMIDGIDRLVKKFGARSHGADDLLDDLNVSKDISFVGLTSSAVASIDGAENVGLSIVAWGDADGPGGMPGLCPWVGGVEIPATNEFIAAGTTVKASVDMFSTAVPSVTSHTDSVVLSTVAPQLTHEIEASGENAQMTAALRVHLMEGNAAVDEDVPLLRSETRYTQDTAATGSISRFHKKMEYNSVIPVWQQPEPWYTLPR